MALLLYYILATTTVDRVDEVLEMSPFSELNGQVKLWNSVLALLPQRGCQLPGTGGQSVDIC
jgi:hypothetical protein